MVLNAMNRLWQYSLAAGVFALLAGCGGEPAITGVPDGEKSIIYIPGVKYTVGGTVSGLGAGAALTLSLGSEKLTVGANGNFAFPNVLESGLPYSVSASAPAGYTCRVTDASGIIPNADVSKIAVACAPVVLAGVVNAMQVPLSVTGDGAGNLYIVDSAAASVLKLSAAGVVGQVAGTMGFSGYVDGVAASARFGFGEGDLAIDGQGNLLVADGCNNAIRKITPDGTVSTLARGGPEVCRTRLAYTTEGAAVVNSGPALFNRPRKIIADGAGGALFLDARSGYVHRVSATGVVSSQYWPNPGPRTEDLTFSAIARSADGTLYLADARLRIWKDVAGTLVLVAGKEHNGSVPFDGTGAAAVFRRITDMVVAPSGDLYITDDIQVRKVTPAGVVTTVAGLVGINLGQDAPGSARFGTLTSITLDATGLVVLDEKNNILRHVGFDGAVSTLAATPGLRGYVDGTGSQARLSTLNSLVADTDGNLYMADEANSVLRKVTPDGTVSRFGGASDGFGLTNGALESATFKAPHTLAAARGGSMWVVQPYSLRKIQDGSVTTVLTEIAILDMTADADGNAVVVEASNTADLTRVVQVMPAGQTSVLVTRTDVKALLKNPAAGFEPEGMATDAAGNLYIADRATSLIFKRTKSGALSVFAGTPLKDTGNVDGPVGTATLGFYGYSFLATDDKGNLYASGHGKLRMISPSGVVSTPNLGWGDVAVGPIAYAKGKLYGMTRFAILQTWLP